MANFVYQEGFFTAVEPLTDQSSSLTNPISLTNPTNIFALQNAVSDNLNSYQTSYARYVRCQDPNTNPQVSDPQCDVNGQDSLYSLNTAYQSLLTSINDLSGSFANQIKINAETPLQYQQESEQFPMDYASMLKLRVELDEQLRELNIQYNGGSGTSVKMLESAAFANTLWIILASCLVYYIVIEL
jgi:hypothetical protein